MSGMYSLIVVRLELLCILNVPTFVIPLLILKELILLRLKLLEHLECKLVLAFDATCFDSFFVICR